ncbi:MAG: acetyl-CoA carboxylase biotin carboxyl carrier protein [Pirellulaceae bacterium]|nr:acetyl-CoA carboxylase biotin carboxyl carrier protein [Pirellulaceae bacterium]
MTKKSTSPSSSGDVFSVDKLRELLELMREFDLNEIDLMQADQQIRLARGGQGSSPVFLPSSLSQPVAASSAAAASGAGSSEPAKPVDGPHIKLVCSPMVGTFYSRPKPGADDYVKIGSRVGPETVLCIVEAMKVFNDIPAECSGTVVEILVKNEEAVDFNRPLFKIDTRG